LYFAFRSTWETGSLATNETTLGAALWVSFNLDGETCFANEPGSRAEPSSGCFLIAVILPGLLPICTRSKSLFVLLVYTFVVDFDAFLPDPLMPDPLTFARRFLPCALAGPLLVSIVLVHGSGCVGACMAAWCHLDLWLWKTSRARGCWMMTSPGMMDACLPGDNG